MSELNMTESQEAEEIIPASELPCTNEAIDQTKAPDRDGQASDSDEEPKASRPTALLLEYLELFVTCLCTILILFSIFFRICNVSGHSMNPTLKDGELLIVSDFLYDPAPGDIIIFHQTSDEVTRFNEPIVKRVIATAGQTVYMDFTIGYVEVDGVRLKEDYIQLVNSLGIPTGKYELFADHHFRMEPQADGQTHRIFEATVPDGTVFVMGDNRNNSSDSRVSVIGFVDERRILGKVLYRLIPGKGFVAAD